MAQFNWTEDAVRRLYQMRAQGATVLEAAGVLGCNRATLELFCSNHYMTPASDAAPLPLVLEIYRNAQGGTARMTDAEETRLRALWAEPGATLRTVGLALKWRRELLVKRAAVLRLGPCGETLPDTPVTRAVLDLCHPCERFKPDTVAKRHGAPTAQVLALLKRVAPRHDALRQSTRRPSDDPKGPPIPDREIHARRMAVLRDRARQIAGGGVSCAHALARELDPLGEHRLTPAQAMALAGIETSGGTHA